MRKVFDSDISLNEEIAKVLLFGMVYNVSLVNYKLTEPQQIIRKSQLLVHFLRVMLRK